MGLIQIENMEFYAFHGHYREEQIVGNRFLVDLEMETDMDKAGRSDRLEDATDYQIAYRAVKDEMEKKSYLLEHIATRILDELFERLPSLHKATVRIRKMNPPMGGNIGSVGVTLSRSR
ncbi:MAG: dihydroneopterin aldolase [Bacteroidales bacterium]|nr:dihydroneopterin aldolase [Bacteroidales bacterium]